LRLLLAATTSSRSSTSDACLAAAAQVLASWRVACGVSHLSFGQLQDVSAEEALEIVSSASSRFATSIQLYDCSVLLAEVSKWKTFLTTPFAAAPLTTTGGAMSSPPPPALVSNFLFLAHACVGRLLQARLDSTWSSAEGYQLALELLPPVTNIAAISLRVAAGGSSGGSHSPSSSSSSSASSSTAIPSFPACIASVAFLSDVCQLFRGIDGREASNYISKSDLQRVKSVYPTAAYLQQQLQGLNTPAAAGLSEILGRLLPVCQSFTAAEDLALVVTAAAPPSPSVGSSKMSSSPTTSAAAAASPATTTAASTTTTTTTTLRELREMIGAVTSIVAFAETSAGNRILRQLVADAKEEEEKEGEAQAAEVLLTALEADAATQNKQLVQSASTSSSSKSSNNALMSLVAHLREVAKKAP
jgi:hypothetical protein